MNFVPLERVERAIRVSEQLGGAYNLEIAYLNLAERKHPQDKQTDALFAELSARLGFEPRSYRGNVFFNGRSTICVNLSSEPRPRGGPGTGL